MEKFKFSPHQTLDTPETTEAKVGDMEFMYNQLRDGCEVGFSLKEFKTFLMTNPKYNALCRNNEPVRIVRRKGGGWDMANLKVEKDGN